MIDGWFKEYSINEWALKGNMEQTKSKVDGILNSLRWMFELGKEEQFGKVEDKMADFKTGWYENILEKFSGKNCEDNVNHPSHYTYGGIETIDYMKAKSTPEEFYGHLRLTALKYLSRAGHKDDTLQDYKKAQWYLNRLIKELEGASNE